MKTILSEKLRVVMQDMKEKDRRFLGALSHNENMLKNLKAKIGANSENHKKNYIDLPEYRRLIVTIYENIAHIFDVN